MKREDYETKIAELSGVPVEQVRRVFDELPAGAVTAARDMHTLDGKDGRDLMAYLGAAIADLKRSIVAPDKNGLHIYTLITSIPIIAVALVDRFDDKLAEVRKGAKA